MKIKSIKCKVVSVPLVDEWKISLYSAKDRGHALIYIETEEGIIGYGEASPSPAFMGETADTIKLVVDKYLAPALIGQNITNIANIHNIMDTIIYGNSSAKSAIDIAVYDALGKTYDKPVYELIGGKVRDSVKLTYVIGMKSDEKLLSEARYAIKQGFETIKIKIGNDFERDLRVITLLFDLFKEYERDIKLRLDGNQGYNVFSIIHLMRKVEKIGDIESLEQPIEKWNLSGLNEIRRKINTPLMADEIVFSENDAFNIIKNEAADIINLKTCKVGGIFKSKMIAGMVESAGLKCAIGSNLELGVGIAASAHVAISTNCITSNSDFICGSYLHKKDITSIPSWDLGKNGYYIPTSDAGLGIQISEDIQL